MPNQAVQQIVETGARRIIRFARSAACSTDTAADPLSDEEPVRAALACSSEMFILDRGMAWQIYRLNANSVALYISMRIASESDSRATLSLPLQVTTRSSSSPWRTSQSAKL